MTAEKPTETRYAQLEELYSTSLQCPCTEIMFTYRSFVELNSQMHQICSSPFVEATWIQSIFGDGNWSSLAANDFRSRGVAYFLVQKSFCDMARRAIDNAIYAFLENQIFKGKLMPKNQLVLSIMMEIEHAQSWNAIDFMSLVRYGRGIIQSNQLMTIFSSNWNFASENSVQNPNNPIMTRPVSHGSGCSCATSFECAEPVFIGNEVVPGFVLGCFPVQSLLQSTLICLYNQTCLNLINDRNLSSVHPLNTSLSSRFFPNSTIKELAESVFVEQWSYNISYSAYFSTCKPLTCTYLMTHRKGILQVISILLGLYGGLTLILRIVALWLVATGRTLIGAAGRNNAMVLPLT